MQTSVKWHTSRMRLAARTAQEVSILLNGSNAVTLGKLLKLNMLAASMLVFSNFLKVTALILFKA